jgi:hypothetical protein
MFLFWRSLSRVGIFFCGSIETREPQSFGNVPYRLVPLGILQRARRPSLRFESRRRPTQLRRLEQEERERKAAAEKTRLEQEWDQKAADKATEPLADDVIEDQLDQAWETERQKRQNELTKAVVEEWSSERIARGNIETELIKTLKSTLNEWLSRRPDGFENRQTKRLEKQQAETKKAIDSWRKRTAR